MTTTLRSTLLASIEEWLNKYLAFPMPEYATIAALWALGTYLWEEAFDAYPYLVITASTRRSGKTILMNLLKGISRNGVSGTGTTGPTLFRLIRDGKPSVFIDEAESFNSDSNDTMQAVTNTGYKRGDAIPRTSKTGEIEWWPTYCPKCFVLIGGVNSTLEDRSIVIQMRRGREPNRLVTSVAQSEGDNLKLRMAAWAKDAEKAVQDAFLNFDRALLDFLPSRDAEIWTPLVIIAQMIAPERVDGLLRAIADVTVEKQTIEYGKRSDLAVLEEEATEAEYGVRLMRDMLSLMNGHKHLFTSDLIEALKAIPTAPWRRFRGEDGLKDIDLAKMLQMYGLKPKLIRQGGKRPGHKVARGYTREAVVDALQKAGETVA